MPGVFRSEKEYGVPVRSWHVPNVRRSNRRLSHLSAFGGEANHIVLKERVCLFRRCSIVGPASISTTFTRFYVFFRKIKREIHNYVALSCYLVVPSINVVYCGWRFQFLSRKLLQKRIYVYTSFLYNKHVLILCIVNFKHMKRLIFVKYYCIC